MTVIMSIQKYKTKTCDFGSFSQCRIYGKYLALQIAIEERRAATAV